MRASLILAALLALAAMPDASRAAPQGSERAPTAALAYVRDLPESSTVTIVDARAQAACTRASVHGAHCLPATDFLGPHGRLASFRQIAWLLGTVGLSGHEDVLVVGDDPAERDFVAGMLYLCGQARVQILTRLVSGSAGLPADALAPGTPRAMTRTAVYQAQVRDDDLVLRTDLARDYAAQRAPLLLDGRSEAEYWGERIRGGRGGHLPGAQSLPMDVLRRSVAAQVPTSLPDRDFVAYGHDAFESVAYFTLLRAGAGRRVRVLADGWTDWAHHPELPVAAEAWEDRGIVAMPVAAAPQPPRWLVPLTIFNAVALLLLAGGFLHVRGRRRST